MKVISAMIVLLLSLGANQALSAAMDQPLSADESYLFKAYLNQLPDNELKTFKQLESIYLSLLQKDNPPGQLNEDDIKLILLFARYSNDHNNAAFQEYLRSDLLPVYQHNEKQFMKVLKDLPFFLTTACDFFNSHFGFEETGSEGKPAFIRNLKQNLEKDFNSSDTDSCLSEFK
ncbi:hypothetical protein [Oceanobacter mangrovi]|uniref:hypothetical protein n=1 Tax=Oceanobacter mangrovi TaxID=2862510 RepID=UPI001C8D3E4B|nr:hypothetical protein [Oceanobacter mangrovi]